MRVLQVDEGKGKDMKDDCKRYNNADVSVSLYHMYVQFIQKIIDIETTKRTATAYAYRRFEL